MRRRTRAAQGADVRCAREPACGERCWTVGADAHLSDTQMGGYDGITSAYLLRSSRPTLVATGAARSAQRVVDELDAAARSAAMSGPAGETWKALTGDAANLSGILRWLDKVEPRPED